MADLGFFAYPEASPTIRDAILGAVDSNGSTGMKLRPWQKMGIIGFKVDDLIREEIAQADVLLADITYPNYNVFYELGYAIGIGKPVIPTLSLAVDKAADRVQRLGLFDTLGWATYTNATELRQLADDWQGYAWTSKYTRNTDHSQPLFIVDALKKTDFRNHIFHAVENSNVNYRSFDPTQVPRLTAAQAISDISASVGVIAPILGSDIVDSQFHNLRAAFIIGLSHGFGLDVLAIQYENGPAPLDYRDFITNSTYRKETEKHVEEYCAKVLVWNQRSRTKSRRANESLLSDVNLGSPTAENETQHLSEYFIKTAEFSRALRAEGAVVIGRKGSGKSAVYLQIADISTRDKRKCVVELRPATHNLSEMRAALLDVATAGIFDHTIAAFWQYIMYIEIILKLREKVIPRARNDFALQEQIRKLEQDFNLSEGVVSGDFTSRLDNAVREVIDISRKAKTANDLRSQLTNFMFEEPIPKLREAVISLADHFDEVVLLIDDLDKGWPPRQVESQDVSTVKHLIEVLNRIQRDLTRKQVGFKHLVFLRSDIYERLVEQTSDRGKYNVIKVDWSDPEQLTHLLRQRAFNDIDPSGTEEVWNALNPKLPSGEQAVAKMIESSLRRPRFLIDLCERTLSFAVNRGHHVVTEDDLEEGLRQMSLYLVSGFGYEMRDIAGTPEDIFYAFIGAPPIMSEVELSKYLAPDKLGIGVADTIDLLLWYGFLGIVGPDSEPIFIYDRAYDFRRLEAERARTEVDALFVVTPPFFAASSEGDELETSGSPRSTFSYLS